MLDTRRVRLLCRVGLCPKLYLQRSLALTRSQVQKYAHIEHHQIHILILGAVARVGCYLSLMCLRHNKSTTCSVVGDPATRMGHRFRDVLHKVCSSSSMHKWYHFGMWGKFSAPAQRSMHFSDSRFPSSMRSIHPLSMPSQMFQR